MPLLSPYFEEVVGEFYEGLTEDQQHLLILYIALYDDVSASALTKHLASWDIRKPSGKRYIGEDVKGLFAGIKEAKLGVAPSGRALHVCPELAAWVGAKVSEEEPFSKYVKMLYLFQGGRSLRPYQGQRQQVIALSHAYYWEANGEGLQRCLLRDSAYKDPKILEPILMSFTHYPFSARSFEQLPDVYREALLPDVHETQSFRLCYSSAWTAYLLELEDPKYSPMLGDMLLLEGNLDEAAQVADGMWGNKRKLMRVAGCFLKGVIAFLKGNQDEAADWVGQGLKLKGNSLRVTLVTEALLGLFLLSREEAVFQNALADMEAKKRASAVSRVLEVYHRPDFENASIEFDDYFMHQAMEMSGLVRVLALHAWIWKGLVYSPDMEKLAKDLIEKSVKQEIPLVAALASGFLKHFGAKEIAETMGLNLPPVAEILPLKRRLQVWEKQLQELERLAESKGAKIFAREEGEAKTSRLIWEIVTVGDQDFLVEVLAKEQRATKKGWTRGRVVSLGRLREECQTLPYVTAQDLPVIEKIKPSPWHGHQWELDCDVALYELAGHSNVYRGETALEITKQTLKFILSDETTGDVALEVQPSVCDLDFSRSGIAVWWETPARVSVMKISPEEFQLVKVLGLQVGSASIPAEGKDRLIKVIEALKDEVNVFTDVEAAGDASVKMLEPNLVLQLHLVPFGEGLKAALRVQPMMGVETFLTPGSGTRVVFAEVEGQACKTERALGEELARASEILEACPSLCENDDGEAFLWSLPEPGDCLELLTEADALRDRLEVLWPQGERFALAGEASTSQMRLRITSTKDWFQLHGELEVAEGEVLQLQELLDLLEKDDALGRFVKLRDGQYLALKREFRQRLGEMDAFTTEGKGGGRRLHALAAHALTEFTEEAQTKLNKKWEAHAEQLREAEAIEAEVPSTLQAELRPYQRDGFRWLARQAAWGVGACLADDMGLGKTVQALALLLHRASLGPALVVAPTSVTRNWLSEAMTFAPTLKVRLFGPGDRAASLAGLQGFDVVVATYGLLPIEIELLEKVKWATIVLDEAQAIKNASTQRWKAAVRLQGDFKVITTGTPIENQLVELHALFQFINPGLLGTAQRFHVKFADPIAKQREEGARQRLKRLIRPFILRRLKNQVLKDLPPRTDIVLRVERSAKEVAFYEALRRKAVKNLTKSKKEEENAGERSLRILAEIMKLRRACCHPQLVDPKVPLGSSKLELFGETIQEVLGNGHKALVFSQFVDHLSFIRDYLEKVGIPYQYLDGQTPGKRRQEAVEAFQRGEGELFLISLRAGGTGLNLTAADYVIHMDPWWNPAVEDQASDRAHRIGQQRPVTVYRLVMADTIEEKIVELHHQKRDLADSLLSGAETAGKLSAEQLLNLLRDER